MLPEIHESLKGAAQDGHSIKTPARQHRILFLQRERRHRLRRIDYYPSERVAAVIDSLRKPRVGHDASGIINRIIEEWSAGGTANSR